MAISHWAQSPFTIKRPLLNQNQNVNIFLVKQSFLEKFHKKQGWDSPSYNTARVNLEEKCNENEPWWIFSLLNENTIDGHIYYILTDFG